MPIVMWLLPNHPATAKFLRHGNDRAIAIERLRENNTGTKNSTWKWYQVRECLSEPRTWGVSLLLGATSSGPNVGPVGAHVHDVLHPVWRPQCIWWHHHQGLWILVIRKVRGRIVKCDCTYSGLPLVPSVLMQVSARPPSSDRFLTGATLDAYRLHSDHLLGLVHLGY